MTTHEARIFLFEIAYEIRLPTPVMLPGRGMYCCTDNIRYCTTHSNVRTHVWPIPSSKNTRRPELLCTGIGVPVSLVPWYACGKLKLWSTLRGTRASTAQQCRYEYTCFFVTSKMANKSNSLIIRRHQHTQFSRCTKDRERDGSST